MAWDEGLAHLLRDDLAEVASLHETPMFGGLCFMVGGHMACGVHGEKRGGGAMARVGKARMAEALALPGTAPMTMGARTMAGFVDLGPEALADEDIRRRLIGMALENARSLPRR